jgi:hypothetical protein
MWGFFLTEIPQICCLYLFDFIQIKGGHYLHQATKQTEQVTVRQNKSNPNKFKGSNNHKDQYLFKQT